MSNITVTTTPNGVPVVNTPTQPVLVTVPVGKKGAKGDKGEQGDPGIDALWERMTQAEYEALPAKDPNTLYVIVQ